MFRSVTAPIAMGVSEVIGGEPSLTAILTVMTGIVGAVHLEHSYLIYLK